MPETEPLRGRDIPVIIVAGLLSAALGGVLATTLVATFLGGVQGIFVGFYLALFAGGEIIGGALLVAGLPAMLLGGLLLKAGEERAWARRWQIWAAVGAVAGAACYGLAIAIDLFGIAELIGPSSPEAWAFLSGIAAFALAGALAALFFRGAFRLGRALIPDSA